MIINIASKCFVLVYITQDINYIVAKQEASLKYELRPHPLIALRILQKCKFLFSLIKFNVISSRKSAEEDPLAVFLILNEIVASQKIIFFIQ